MRLVVVSNRVTLPNDCARRVSGLAVGLIGAMQGCDSLWVGWNGDVAQANLDFQAQAGAGMRYLTTALSQRLYEAYYCGYANSVLWPALHQQAELVKEQPGYFAAYQEVNAGFAGALKGVLGPQDVVWVHDYHFMSLAQHVRRLGLRQKMGFFMHIPFGAPKVWASLSDGPALIQALTQYDAIGVQTETDKIHVLQSFQAFAPDQAWPNVTVCPIGVNYDAIQAEVTLNRVSGSLKQIDAPGAPMQSVVSVDRVDPAKGLLQKLDAWDQLLEAHPHWRGRVSFTQIACPSRMDVALYQAFHAQLQARLNALNEKFATDVWRPVRWREEILPHGELMGLLASAQVCWINSVQDGMNLVAKEYIAAQSDHHPGVLVLSQYAGAARQLPWALLTNPHAPAKVAETLHQALSMSPSERSRRHLALKAAVQKNDIVQWRKACLAALMTQYDEAESTCQT